MDDRNLVAVAEQAAATSLVQQGPIAGCTVLADDGRVFMGCLVEYANADLNQDPVSNAIAVGRVSGMRRVQRVGYYSPTNGELPTLPACTLKRLQEIGTDDLAVLFSPGTGERIEKSLSQLLAEAGLE
jgi:cytidine deaminase